MKVLTTVFTTTCLSSLTLPNTRTVKSQTTKKSLLIVKLVDCIESEKKWMHISSLCVFCSYTYDSARIWYCHLSHKSFSCNTTISAKPSYGISSLPSAWMASWLMSTYFTRYRLVLFFFITMVGVTILMVITRFYSYIQTEYS